MPNNKQAAKRMRQSETRRTQNKQLRTAMRSAVKKVLQAESRGAAEEALPTAMKRVDKAAKQNVIHANAAARTKSRLARATSATADIKLAAQTDGPTDGAATGLHASFELRTRHGIPKSGPIGDDLARTLLHGYYACVSYVDAQIGKMLKAVDEAGIRDNTIIIVWGDHGWHLGDMGIWGKATNYEIATRVPLMIWTPDMKARGKKTDALVELVDMYPTLCELAGLPLPKHLEGKSFVPLLDNPDKKWKSAVLSQFPNPALREWAANPLSPGMRQTFFGPLIEDVEQRIIKQQGDSWNRELFENHLMGYSLRTDRHRLVVWRDHRNPTADPVFVELFDHKKDPKETVNVARQRPRLVKKLTSQLNAILD